MTKTNLSHASPVTHRAFVGRVIGLNKTEEKVCVCVLFEPMTYVTGEEKAHCPTAIRTQDLSLTMRAL